MVSLKSLFGLESKHASQDSATSLPPDDRLITQEVEAARRLQQGEGVAADPNAAFKMYRDLLAKIRSKELKSDILNAMVGIARDDENPSHTVAKLSWVVRNGDALYNQSPALRESTLLLMSIAGKLTLDDDKNDTPQFFNHLLLEAVAYSYGEAPKAEKQQIAEQLTAAAGSPHVHHIIRHGLLIAAHSLTGDSSFREKVEDKLLRNVESMPQGRYRHDYCVQIENLPNLSDYAKQEITKIRQPRDDKDWRSKELTQKKIELAATCVQRTPPQVRFDEIKGQAPLVENLKAIADQINNPDIYRAWGAEFPTGILMYGPPGTGKTMAAKALACEVALPFITFTAADVASKWIGDLEKFTRFIFEIADEEARNSPSGRAVLFLDEVDTLLPSRDHDTEEAERNQLAEVLTALDGFKSSGRVFVIAATNRPDLVDPAFRSRMSSEIEVPLPDAQGRQEILQSMLKARSAKAGREIISSRIDFGAIAEATVGFSGRDFKHLVNTVTLNKARESSTKGVEAVSLISTQDLLEVVKSFKKPGPPSPQRLVAVSSPQSTTAVFDKAA